MGLKGRAYFSSYYPTPAILSKLKLEDFTLEAELTLNPGEEAINITLIDLINEFIYVGCDTAPGIIAKVKIEDFSRVEALTLLTGEDYISSGVIDPANKKAYFSCGTAPAKIVKINLEDFTREDILTLAANRDDPHSGFIDTKGGYAYFETSQQAPPININRLIKIELATFTAVGELAFSEGESLEFATTIQDDGLYAYLGMMTPTQVFLIKVHLPTMTEDSRIALTGTTVNPSTMIIAKNLGSLLMGTLDYPGKIILATLTPLTEIQTLTLETGEDALRSSVYDPTKHMAYFGTDTTPGLIIKIDAQTFTRIAALSGGASTDDLKSACIEPSKGRIDHLPLLGVH